MSPGAGLAGQAAVPKGTTSPKENQSGTPLLFVPLSQSTSRRSTRISPHSPSKEKGKTNGEERRARGLRIALRRLHAEVPAAEHRAGGAREEVAVLLHKDEELERNAIRLLLQLIFIYYHLTYYIDLYRL